MSLFRLVALILFIVAAVLLFLVGSSNLRTDLGLIAAGLAALSLAEAPWDRKLSG